MHRNQYLYLKTCKRYIVLCAAVFSLSLTPVFAAWDDQPGLGHKLTPIPEPVAAPDFTLEDMDEEKHSFRDLRGKVVYLDFWASWCGPCRKSFPWMNAMQARYGSQDFVVVAVNVDKDAALAQRFLAEYPAKFTVAYDPDGSIAAMYQVKGMPSSYLIDREGKLRASHIGFREKDKPVLESRIESLVAGKALLGRN